MIAAIAPTDALDYSISLGNLLQVGAFVVFITIYIVNSRGAAKVLAARLETVDATIMDFKIELKKLSEVLIGQAQQDGRINLLEQRLMQEGIRIDGIAENLGDFKNMILEDTLKRPGARS
jgi:hypothetical protein